MKEQQPIRVAHIVGKMVGGGVEAFIMNYYRNIDKKKFQFDFIIDEDSTEIPKEEIESMGGRIIFVSPYQKIFQYTKEMKRILKENEYKVVHSHLNSLSIFPLYCAWKCKIPIRIAHSHSTTNKKEWKKNLLKNFLKNFSKIFATHYFACTEHAAKWLFGVKTFKSGKVFVLNNAICLEKFEYNENTRKRIRNELSINENTFVVGNVGRFVTQKNHEFLIDIFKEIYEKKKNSILLLIGQGPLQENIRKKVELLGLKDNVKFLNQRLDVNELYQAFDVFLLPSLYEGLGMVYIEAQVSGLYSFASTEVPQIAKVTPNMKFISLDESAEKWADEILRTVKGSRRVGYSTQIAKNGFDIKKETKLLEKKYIKLLEGEIYENFIHCEEHASS